MQPEVIQQIIDALRRRGIDVKLAHPGCIAAMSDADEPTYIHWGDNNETITGDVIVDCIIDRPVRGYRSS
jgi:hypothetical protein